MPRYADLASYTAEENAAWEKIASAAGKAFFTAKGLSFCYAVRGNELQIDRKEKTVTRATVIRAYRRVKELGGHVCGPREMGVFGASYLYPVFAYFGWISADPKEKNGGEQKAKKESE